jgi:hypothetical protein
MEGMEVLLNYVPFVILLIVYYKVFRIASDLKEIKKMLNDKKE